MWANEIRASLLEIHYCNSTLDINGRINQLLSALVHVSLSLSIEGDYLKLSQFPYNSHQSLVGPPGS